MGSITRTDIPVTEQILHALREWIPVTGCRHIHVAYSGGLDSTVLLHALASLTDQIGPIPVHAVHVHHQLNPGADAWVQHCRAFCKSLNIPLRIKRITITEKKGLGIEAAARKARYAALQEVTGKDDLLLTAHHQDDQAETFLLQLLRGSGVYGLAAMPEKKRFGAGWHGRPLLGLSRQSLRDYAMHHKLGWIEDDSNQDTALSRNYIRHQVMPELLSRWPAASQTIARSARLCAEQIDLLESLIQEEFSQRHNQNSACLKLDGLLEREKIAHLKALLRYFIKTYGLSMPNFRKMQEFCMQLVEADMDRMPEMTWSSHCIKRYGSNIYLVPDYRKTPDEPIPFAIEDTSVDLGPFGCLDCQQSQQGRGLSLASIRDRVLTVRFRKGGERIRLSGRSGSTTLKQLFQEHHVPPWERERMPLIYADEELIMVPGAGIHRDYAVSDGPCLCIIWNRPSIFDRTEIIQSQKHERIEI